MQYTSQLLVKTYILIFTATWGSCWQYFSPLSELKLMHSDPETMYIHSEYLFGHCKSKYKKLYAHTHLDHIDILRKLIVRGWIDVMRIPTCIILRGMSHYGDLATSTAYPFQMCVPRITYCYSHHRWKLYYYEWYIPREFYGGMDWEIYFYGPPSAAWQ